MPTPNTNLGTFSRTFADMTISAPQFFEAGRQLSPAEADWLNGQLAGVVGNQFAGYVRRAKEALMSERLAAMKAKTYSGPMDETGKKPAFPTSDDLAWDFQSRYDDLYAEYSFLSNRGSDGVKSDPLTSRINLLASDIVKAKLISKKLKVRDYMQAKLTVAGEEISAFKNLVNQYIDAHPELAETAREQLEAAKAAANATVEEDELDFGIPETQAEAA